MRIPYQRTTPPTPTPTPTATSRPAVETQDPAPSRKTWTEESVRQLGMTTDLETAASIFGIGRTLAYDLLRAGQFPVPPLRLGRRVLIPIAGILAVLGTPVQDLPSDQPPAPTEGCR